MNLDLTHTYMSREGRIGRAEFWVGSVAVAVLVLIFSLIVLYIYGPGSLAFRLTVVLFELIVAYPCYALLAKRFQDRGKPGALAAIPVAVTLLIALIRLSGWAGTDMQPNGLDLVLSSIAVVLAVWILIDLGILRGTVGPNEYGPDPVGTM